MEKVELKGVVMGLAKSEWIDSQERGWDAPAKCVCAECVEDEYLQSVIVECASETHCDYCGRDAEEAIAAPVEAILDPISYALFSHFAEPGAAGLPRDSGEWIGEEQIADTYDALLSLALNCEDDLFEDIAESFHNTAWYPCADGHWLDLHEHQELGYAWSSFVYEIKHRSRYFLFVRNSRTDSAPDERYTPIALLQRIGKLVQELKLIKSVPVKTRMYRVRRIVEEVELKDFKEVGPPPEEHVGAGRMNPPGISYFYLALESETALAETLDKPPCHVAVAEFELTKELLLLDLTELPSLPSVFDSERRGERQGLLFLQSFVEAIAVPVTRDGREHVDYIPSQVVCEFFAQVMRTDEKGHLGGIEYPSAVRPGGKNVVVFPPRDIRGRWEDRIKLMNIVHVCFHNWEELKKAI